MSKMFKKLPVWLLFISLPLLFITSCKEDDEDDDQTIIISPGANAADEAQTAFIEAEDGTTIMFEEGTFSFTNTLSMDGQTNIIIKGAGRDLSILDFSSQTSGGDGVLVTNSSNVRFENITIQDSEGDGLKTRDCDGVSFVNIATIWTGTPSASNGAYGLYPVLCTKVYIDNCYAYGASDAGIYVGQSDQIIVKNCVAEGNVAGIEIENSNNADVFDNEAFDNTGGILVFDLPGLTQYGDNVRVFDNDVHDNNRTNFAPVGNIVGSVPAGTGFMILSTNTVEVFNNTFTNNEFCGVLIASYLFVDPNPNDPGFQPLPYGISIHDNSYSMTGMVNPTQPAIIDDITNLLAGNGFAHPNILLDGIYAAPQVICIQEPSNPTFVNINAAADMSGALITDDMTPHDCIQTPLAEVSFDPF
ncbi:MAG: parallel beta-helix repeat protein [Chitinophagales bacterium]|jgi:parallel beta-helix repeat protein